MSGESTHGCSVPIGGGWRDGMYVLELWADADDGGAALVRPTY